MYSKYSLQASNCNSKEKHFKWNPSTKKEKQHKFGQLTKGLTIKNSNF